MEKQTDFRKELINLRQKTGLNQTQFAEKVNCSSAHISQMELGKTPVKFETLQKYANIFNWHYPVELNCGENI